MRNAAFFSRKGVSPARLRGTGERLHVLVETLGSETDQIGLTEEWLRNRTELALLSAGIRVDPNSDGRLYVNLKLSDGIFRVDVELKRRVIFQTASGVWHSSFGKVWDCGSGGKHHRDRERVVSTIEQHLSEFLNDYLMANPVHSRIC